MLWIERLMAAITSFIACDLFGLDSRDVERVRKRELGDNPMCQGTRRDRQVVVRFGR